MNLKITCKYPEHTVTTPTGSEENKFDKVILEGILENHGCTDIKIEKISSKRTLTLNAALHLWLKKIEIHCMNLGLTMYYLLAKPKRILKHKKFLIEKFGHIKELNDIIDYVFKVAIPDIFKTELPITEHSLKDYFRAVGKHLFGKKSTADHTNKEMLKTIETCEMLFTERLDWKEEFPNKKQLLLGKLKK